MSAAPSRPRLYFDFADPVSFLLERELTAVEAEAGFDVERVGIEVSPPPHPLGAPDDPLWGPRWSEAESVAGAVGLSLRRPVVVPWTRKAHELARHAEEEGQGAVVRAAIYRAFFEQGRDIGRVDVLVELSRGVGLDASATKAVLDVDRFGEEVAAGREEAVRSGIRFIPTLVAGARRVEGFRNRAWLSTFLDGSPGPVRPP